MAEEEDPFKTGPSKNHGKAIISDERNTVSTELESARVTAASSSTEATDPALVPVQDKITVHSTRRIQPEITLHKVPHRLREVNEKAYEPNVISIGPYHHGKPHLAPMEIVKRRCFWEIDEEIKIGIDGFQATMKTLEKKARMCYEEPLPFPLNLESKEYFLDMMLYDGCFIVQQILKCSRSGIFEAGHIQTNISNDLLLLENQLPFFVILELYKMMMPPDKDKPDFTELVFSFYRRPLDLFPAPDALREREKFIHLLGIVHSTYQPSSQGIKKHQIYSSRQGSHNSSSDCIWKCIRSATELEDAGIDFSGDDITNMIDEDKGIKSMFDIEFATSTNREIKCFHDMLILTTSIKVLRIPTLRVDHSTERILRNYMAYEQFIRAGEPTYYVDYVIFMDNLINTCKDVQLLCMKGVIDNRLGDYEAVAQMFNKLREHIYMSQDLYYAEIFDKVNEHCQKKWNRWRAALKKDYFKTPWSILSFVAAVSLLLLTLLQTIFTFLSYYKQWG